MFPIKWWRCDTEDEGVANFHLDGFSEVHPKPVEARIVRASKTHGTALGNGNYNGRRDVRQALSISAFSRHPENPTFNLGGLALARFKLGVTELFKTAITVRPSQPFGGRKGILLVGRPSRAWESPAPQRRIDLGDHGAVGRHTPAVEQPEVNGPP